MYEFYFTLKSEQKFSKRPCHKKCVLYTVDYPFSVNWNWTSNNKFTLFYI